MNKEKFIHTSGPYNVHATDELKHIANKIENEEELRYVISTIIAHFKVRQIREMKKCIDCTVPLPIIKEQGIQCINCNAIRCKRCHNKHYCVVI